MTLSVGCRAPSAADLVTRVAESLSTSVTSTATARYQDGNLVSQYLDTDEKTDRAGPSITPTIRNDMKALILTAVQDLLDNPSQEHVWDAILGQTLTEPNRYLDGAVQPFDEIIDDDYLDIWGPTPAHAMKRVRQRGCLTRAPGVSFATSQVTSMEKNNTAVAMDRIYGFGQMWQVRQDTLSANVFSKIERGQSVDRHDLKEAPDDLVQVLQQMVAEGLLLANDK